MHKPLQKNTATEYQTIDEPNFLYEMDQITQEIIKSLLESQNTGLLGVFTVLKATQKG